MLREKRAILIIGAGVAGLAAACDLALGGLQVVLLEARQRIGGRIYTQYDDSSPVPIELGAEFVHGKPPELLGIIETARLLFGDVTERHWYFENGILSKSADFWHKLNELMDQMKPTEPDRSFKEFVESLPDDAETRRAKAVALRYVQGFHAARPERIGVHGLIRVNEAADEIDGDNSFRVLSGYDGVLESLRRQAQQAGAVIHLNTVVKQLYWSSQHVAAICATGDQVRSFNATAAVITLPLGVLQAGHDKLGAVRLVPGLPSEMQTAIRGLEMGQVVKITLRFRDRFWEQLKLPDLEDQLSQLGFIHFPEAPIPTWWTLLPIRAPLLVGWVGGPQAEGILQHDHAFLLHQALASLSRIFQVSESYLRGELEASYAHDWNSDPFARGAYSYVPVNGLGAQETLSRPVDNTLFFAGEATSVGHVGTVHGALSSGQRAAKQVLST